MRYEMRLAGSGGQGIIIAGIILAEAGILEGYHVIQSQNYGPEARGGSSVSEVILSDAEIDYPKTLGLDILLVFNQKACDENLHDMKPVPLSRLSQRKYGEQKFANVLAVGALVPFCSWFSAHSIRKAIARRMPQGTIRSNLAAFREGIKLGNDLKKNMKLQEIEGPAEV